MLVVLQNINNFALNNLTTASLFSTFLSAYITLNSIYRWGYYTLFMGVNYKYVPHTFTVTDEV
jgi:hypothetical protein